MDKNTPLQKYKIVLPANFDLKKYEEKDGVDIGLLLCTLNRTPTERAEYNKNLLLFMEEVKKSRNKKANGCS